MSEGGLKLAPAFKGGTAAVQEQLEKLKELAVVYSEDFVRSAEGANDELGMFRAQFAGLGSELILTFLPTLRGAVRELTPVIRGLREGFTSGHLFGASLTSAGAIGLASFGGIGGAIARFAPLLGRLAAMAAPFIWAFAKFALLTLILDDFFVMLNGGKSVLGELLGKFELGRTILETFQNGFKLLKGSVLLAWGALAGDEAAMNKGKALLDEFSKWIDGFADNVGFMFSDLFSRVIPDVVSAGWNSLDESTRETLSSVWEFVSNWASELGGLLGGMWDAAIAGLTKMVNYAGELLKSIPGVGDLLTTDGSEAGEWQPISPSSIQAKAELLNGGKPTLPPSASGNVTVNNNQTFSTNIGAGAPKEVVKAVQQTERTYDATLAKSNRQTLRQVVGATR